MTTFLFPREYRVLRCESPHFPAYTLMSMEFLKGLCFRWPSPAPATVLLINVLLHLVPVILSFSCFNSSLCLIHFLHPLIFLSTIGKNILLNLAFCLFFFTKCPRSYPTLESLLLTFICWHLLSWLWSKTQIFLLNFRPKLRTGDTMPLPAGLKGSATWTYINPFKPALSLFL